LAMICFFDSDKVRRGTKVIGRKTISTIIISDPAVYGDVLRMIH